MAMKPNGDFPFFTGNSPVALYYCNRCRNGRLLDRKMRPSTIWSWSSMVMVLSSDFGRSVYIGYYNKRPSGNIKVQNLSIVGIRELIIIGLLNYYPAMSHLLSGIVVSMVMEYAENIVKVYLTTVALLLTAVVSVYLFNFHVSLAFFLGSTQSERVMLGSDPDSLIVKYTS
ncbi:BnaC03g17350D [Brassica napus]|uniref:BnaC03g17350D protein n=1 Tax=Brassica napus TaxID=3708 RepID=A0A078GEY6_BRANA|nr:BnaC03g17350D [Brassica napus]